MRILASLLAAMGVLLAQEGAPRPAAPVTLDMTNLSAVVSVLREHYVEPSALADRQVNAAAVRGVLNHLGAGAKIVEAKPARKTITPEIAKTEMLGDDILYIRLGRLSKDTAAALDGEMKARPRDKLHGIILDLRFVGGGDFADAAQVAGRFLAKGAKLFVLAGPTRPPRTFTASFDNPCTDTPLIVVVNRETFGSAEALAATLSHHQRAAVVGNTTAGEACERAELPLSDGRKLALAVSQIVLPDGRKIFPRGVEPDVPVKLDLEKERKLVLGPDAQKNLRASLEPKVSRRRVNEAELVRVFGPDDNKSAPASEEEPHTGNIKVEQPADVVLTRALDILKGLRALRR
ncbi:MAG: S41 family peptidase [Verrucomicrobiae bacterium]|nr:S41 family peptidase [Verrucomicrobiae bacterium]